MSNAIPDPDLPDGVGGSHCGQSVSKGSWQIVDHCEYHPDEFYILTSLGNIVVNATTDYELNVGESISLGVSNSTQSITQNAITFETVALTMNANLAVNGNDSIVLKCDQSAVTLQPEQVVLNTQTLQLQAKVIVDQLLINTPDGPVNVLEVIQQLQGVT